MKVYLTIAESLGTDNEFASDVYTSTTSTDARNLATSLIANMIEAMDLDRNIDPNFVWNLDGADWFYRVRVEEVEIDACQEKESNQNRYATHIEWDTDSDDVYGDDEIELPEYVEIPKYVDDEFIADYLSDRFGFCVFGFDIKRAII